MWWMQISMSICVHMYVQLCTSLRQWSSWALQATTQSTCAQILGNRNPALGPKFWRLFELSWSLGLGDLTAPRFVPPPKRAPPRVVLPPNNFPRSCSSPIKVIVPDLLLEPDENWTKRLPKFKKPCRFTTSKAKAKPRQLRFNEYTNHVMGLGAGK